MYKNLLPVTTLAVSLLFSFSAAPAQAALILGSHVEGSLFLGAIAPNTHGWVYFGENLGPPSPFWVGGHREVRQRSSSYLNTFGYSDASHGNRVEIFGGSAGAGATYGLAESRTERFFYFSANGTDLLLASDDNRQYTDGFARGGTPGRFQGGMDIFYHAGSKAWAFFFDDAGGGIPILGDDNDYDDLIVMFRQNPVPEPASLGLLGVALLGFTGLTRRKKMALAKV